MTMEQFLDRLMVAESGGRLLARNSRSTALGPYQFIESTFLSVARRYFAEEVGKMAPPQILALRTDVKFARRAAEAYTRENASVLVSNQLAPSFPHLRLAFFAGPGGAVRVLKAPPETLVAHLLGPAALLANPFMAGMTAQGLIARAARDIALPPSSPDGVAVPTSGKRPVAGLQIRCNIRLPSCKRWVALRLRAKPRTPPTVVARAASRKLVQPR